MIEVLAAVALVAETPAYDARVVAVAKHHALYAVYDGCTPCGGGVYLAVVCPVLVELYVGFVHHV